MSFGYFFEKVTNPKDSSFSSMFCPNEVRGKARLEFDGQRNKRVLVKVIGE